MLIAFIEYILDARHGTKYFMYIIVFKSDNNLWGRHYNFTGEKTLAQRGSLSCPVPPAAKLLKLFLDQTFLTMPK